MLPVVLWPGGKGGGRRKPRRAKCPAEDSFGFPRETGGTPFRARSGVTKAEPGGRAGSIPPALLLQHKVLYGYSAPAFGRGDHSFHPRELP